MKNSTTHKLATLGEVDALVHAEQLRALKAGMIPIAAVLSRRAGDGLHEVLGVGCNHLAEGKPGIHGETGAIINMGRRPGGYSDIVATSSLSPCPFCQCTMVRHMGMREVRILDDLNYRPDKGSYAGLGVRVESLSHKAIERTFQKWLGTVKNRPLWARDIGEFGGEVGAPFPLTSNRRRLGQVLGLAHGEARLAMGRGEAPVGAVVLDAQGEVIGCGGSEVVLCSDPTMVAAMAAWRACGAREHWMDKTLVLTTGPDAIAYSMFQIFNFGQIIVASDQIQAGYLPDLRALNGNPQRARPVIIKVLRDTTTDESLANWIGGSPAGLVREYFGQGWEK